MNMYMYIFSAVFATGSRDGHIMVWDVRCSKKGIPIRQTGTYKHYIKDTLL